MSNSLTSLIKRAIASANVLTYIGRIRRSGLFDQEWYLQHNPDVAASKLDPLVHYLRYGGFEGRDPGPGFRSASYLNTHEDAKRDHVNPLVHYLQNAGRLEPGSKLRESVSFSAPFWLAFLAEVRSSALNWYADNYDVDRFGSPPVEVMREAGDVQASLAAAIGYLAPNGPEFEWLYEILGDDASRRTLVKVLAFRALGHRRVKLPLNTPAFWDGRLQISKLADSVESLHTRFANLDWELPLMDLHQIGVPIRFYGIPAAAHRQFVLEQYRCGEIAVERGDCVVDAGTCWGETALYFAQRAGGSGSVIGFEFVPENLEILHRNLGLNPDLAGIVQVVERAAWSDSGASLEYDVDGPATRIPDQESVGGKAHAVTLSIDDLVSERRLPRIDFIKMDIEGSELRALQGATRTLAQFRPKLAISVYHNLQDFFEIPRFLASLDLGYRFSLRHFTIHAAETVLFAAVT